MTEPAPVDARGLSCPMPALLAKKALAEADQGTLQVRVDNATSRDNVARAAQRDGWDVRGEDQNDGSWTLTLTKPAPKQPCAQKQPAEGGAAPP